MVTLILTLTMCALKKAMRSICHLRTKVSMPSPATMYITIFQDMTNRSFVWRPCGY